VGVIGSGTTAGLAGGAPSGAVGPGLGTGVVATPGLVGYGSTAPSVGALGSSPFVNVPGLPAGMIP
jgi:hypothetical protein